MGLSNKHLPLITGDAELKPVLVSIVSTATLLPKARPKFKRRSRKPNKSECGCGCGMKKNPKRRFVAGHSLSAKCFPERVRASTRHTSRSKA